MNYSPVREETRTVEDEEGDGKEEEFGGAILDLHLDGMTFSSLFV